jgi:hypothetical protein
MKAFSFEIYTKNPQTGEPGWDIKFVNVFTNDMQKAKSLLKTVPDFDCIILFNHSCELDNDDIEAYEKGNKYRFTSGYPYYS